MLNAYKFVNWEVPALDSLVNTKIGVAIQEADAGNNTLLKSMYDRFSFGCEYLLQGFYRLQGWQFDIKPYCKQYLVRQRYSDCYYKYYAPNKTCLYKALGGRYNVVECMEVEKNV